MDEREVRLRCIEAASKALMVHQTGPAVGVLEVARVWAAWVIGPPPAQVPLKAVEGVAR